MKPIPGYNDVQAPLNDAERQVCNDYQREFIERLNSENIVQALNLQKGRTDKPHDMRYICPICGNGKGSDGTGGCKVERNKIKCHAPKKCFGEHYEDVLGALCKIKGKGIDDVLRSRYPDFDYGKALSEARKSGRLSGAGLSSPAEPSKPASPLPAGSQKPATEPKEQSSTATTAPPAEQLEYYSQCLRASEQPAARAYFEGRGFTSEQMNKYKLMYHPKEKRAVIPISRSFYLARALDDSKPKYKQPAKCSIQMFNIKALAQSETPVYIAEGTLDAISIIEAGGTALSVNSASNAEQLTERIRAEVTAGHNLPPLLLCFDNDDAGRTAAETVSRVLDELSLPYRQSSILGSYHDANERYAADKAGLAAAIAEEMLQYTRPDNTKDYILGAFFDDVKAFQERGEVPTGFKNYDKRYKGIYPGVYILAAASSIGKTTFIHQLGENLAENGSHVIYFSTEQSKLELVSKSIARRSALADITKGVSNIAIRTGRYIPDNMGELVRDYAEKVGERFSIIYTGITGLTSGYVRQYTEDYISRNGVKPCLIIDYLQVMKPDDEKLSRDKKQSIDDSFHKLIALSKEYKITVIVISSVNRSNYLCPIDFESFKESGELEFGADVVLGLQLECMNNPIFNSTTGIVKKRNLVKSEKSKLPRHVELVTLKDRYNGLRDTDGGLYFDYYPQYDLFIEGHRHSEYYGETTSEAEKPSINELYEFDDDDERL